MRGIVGQGTVRNIFGDQGNLERNFWEQGNSEKVHCGEHLNLFFEEQWNNRKFSQGTREQANPLGLLANQNRASFTFKQLFRFGDGILQICLRRRRKALDLCQLVCLYGIKETRTHRARHKKMSHCSKKFQFQGTS